MCLKKMSSPATCAVSGFVHSSTLKMEATCSSLSRWLTFNGMHGVTYQKTELFTAKAVTPLTPLYSALPGEKQLLALYRVITMKRPEFIVQCVYNETR
jgi:hypothetical protein